MINITVVLYLEHTQTHIHIAIQLLLLTLHRLDETYVGSNE